MQEIRIGRFDQDPEAQGVIRPKDESWQLVIDKEGYPHLYVRCNLDDAGEGKPGTGLLCIDDMLPDDLTIPDLMKGSFGGKLSPEEEKRAVDEYMERKDRHGIPCPR